MFLLGRWKNYDDLEESLCFEELVATINAMREREQRERKFLAALQGVDLDEEITSSESVGNKYGDIVDVNGYKAAQEGFGIGMGLGYAEFSG